MPLVQKRPTQIEATPPPPPQRRRRSPSSVSSAGSDASTQDTASSTHEQMVKKLVRLALASEYSRQPIRRTDINAKVLAPNTRAFKHIFAAAQECLRSTFGMVMTELPLKEKITVAQKRAAQRSNGNLQGGSSSSNVFVLTSTLPPSLRAPSILVPSKAPSNGAEASYIGLYTFVVSVIYLHQSHRCTEGKLERELKRVNADNHFLGGEKTEKVLKRMEKEGYIVKIREKEAGGEESVEWMVGPRGRVEIGETGVAGLVRGVYGKRGVEKEELDRRLERSLGVRTFSKKSHGESEEGEGPEAEAEEVDAEETGAEEDQGTGRRRASRRNGAQDEEDDVDDDDEE